MIDTRVTIICLMFSKTTRITLKKGRHFLENGIQNGGYNGMMYLGILFLESTPHNGMMYLAILFLESTPHKTYA